MGLNAINGCLTLTSGEMDYIRFGNGKLTMVMLPGVGDGLKTVKGMALPFAMMYRPLARHFTVYVFSRRRELPEHMTTREMAADLNEALEALGLEESAVVGVSQGGMIAQWLAIDHPEKVGKLVLVVTTSRPNGTIVPLGRLVVTTNTSFPTFSGWSIASHWAIIPPCETPTTADSSSPSASSASFRSAAISRVVMCSGSSLRRLNT